MIFPAISFHVVYLRFCASPCAAHVNMIQHARLQGSVELCVAGPWWYFTGRMMRVNGCSKVSKVTSEQTGLDSGHLSTLTPAWSSTQCRPAPTAPAPLQPGKRADPPAACRAHSPPPQTGSCRRQAGGRSRGPAAGSDGGVCRSRIKNQVSRPALLLTGASGDPSLPSPAGGHIVTNYTQLYTMDSSHCAH